MIFHFCLYFGKVVSCLKTGKNMIIDYWILGELLFYAGCKTFLKPNNIEDVAYIHESKEFILGHDFTKLAITA
ncbi:hypothetical protein SDC9_156941 [bioreactor metagenome]|uniref:Uncharacterized protein n=1 Tax=bioreactor metagenome TaxID=1076179 RepID=A0A645F6Y9_9ZZZZ